LSAVGVREADRADLGQLAAWNAELINDERNDAPLPVEELALRMREWLAAEYRACIFDDDGVPCGYALFRDLAECTHLRHFFVDAAHRRQGIGARAFAQLRRDWFANDKRVLVEVLVWNAQATAFWKHVGFEERYLGLTLT
jgi:GNAT superfamily N-acetyltransferase